MENLKKVPVKILLTVISIAVLMSSMFAFMPNVHAEENYKTKFQEFTKKAINESINKEKFKNDGFAWKYDDNTGKLKIINDGDPEADLTLFDGNTGIIVGVEKVHNYMLDSNNGIETVSLKSVQDGKPITPAQVDAMATALGGGNKLAGLKVITGSELSAQLLDGKDIKKAKVKDVYGKSFNITMHLKDGTDIDFGGEIQSLNSLKEQAKAEIDKLTYVDKDAYKEQIDAVKLDDWENIEKIKNEAIKENAIDCKDKLKEFIKKTINENINKERFTSEKFAWDYDENNGYITIVNDGNPEADLTLFDGNTGIVVAIEKLHDYMMESKNGVDKVLLKSVNDGKPVTISQVDQMAMEFGGGNKLVGLKLMTGSELSEQLLNGKDIKKAKVKDLYGKVFATTIYLKGDKQFTVAGEILSLKSIKDEAKAEIDKLSDIDKNIYKEKIDAVNVENWKNIDSIVDEAKKQNDRGWKIIEGERYFYDRETGNMSKGWLFDNNQWYYLDEETGAMVTGWAYVDGKWYYMNKYGAMVTGWDYIDGKWYYMNNSGAMVTGWAYVDGKWYYMNNSGAMVTGWAYVGGKWYYMNTSGAMVTGRQKIGNTYYRFSNDGVLIK